MAHILAHILSHVRDNSIKEVVYGYHQIDEVALCSSPLFRRLYVESLQKRRRCHTSSGDYDVLNYLARETWSYRECFILTTHSSIAAEQIMLGGFHSFVFGLRTLMIASPLFLR